MARKAAKPIRRTTKGKKANYRPTKKGDPNSRIRQARRRWKC